MVYLIDFTPLTRFLVHEARVDAWHDLVEVLAAVDVRFCAYTFLKETHKLNVLFARI